MFGLEIPNHEHSPLLGRILARVAFRHSTDFFVGIVKTFPPVDLLESAQIALEVFTSLDGVVTNRLVSLAADLGVAITNIQMLSKERERRMPFPISHLTVVPPWNVLNSLMNNLFIVLLLV